MHIELEDKQKALDMVSKLYEFKPNYFINKFWDAVEPDSFVQSMKQLMSEDRGNIRLKITIEKVNIEKR